MRQALLTLEGMRQGVRDSDVFLLVLTETVLGRPYCQEARHLPAAPPCSLARSLARAAGRPSRVIPRTVATPAGRPRADASAAAAG